MNKRNYNREIRNENEKEGESKREKVKMTLHKSLQK